MPESDRDTTVRQIAERLAHRFPGSKSSHVSAVVAEEYDLLTGSPIRIYVPNLVEHEARARLRHKG